MIIDNVDLVWFNYQDDKFDDVEGHKFGEDSVKTSIDFRDKGWVKIYQEDIDGEPLDLELVYLDHPQLREITIRFNNEKHNEGV